MNYELLKIETINDRITISARELHRFLDASERFNNWFERISQYGLEEGIDYSGCKVFNTLARKELQDYQLTIDAAKQISMLQRNEKGTQARKYFIEVEKAWNSPDRIMARALEIAKKHIISLSSTIEMQKPKVLFAESVESSKHSILVGELAKLLKQNGVEIGQNRLFEELRRDGFLIKRKGSDYNMPSQYSMELKLMEIRETIINNPDGSTRLTKTPKVTGKGQIYFIERYLGNK